MLRRSTVAALMCAMTQMVAAQAASVPLDSLVRGTEVRMWSQDPPLKGWKLRYLGRTDTSLVVAERPGSAPVAGFHNEMPFSRVERLELSSGKRFSGERVGKGVLAGAAIGGLTGVFSAAVAAAATVGDEGLVLPAIAFGTLGAAAGGVIGGVVGAQGVTVWTQVRIP